MAWHVLKLWCHLAVVGAGGSFAKCVSGDSDEEFSP